MAKVGPNRVRGPNGYPSAVLELLSLIIGATRSAVRGRNDLILENLLFAGSSRLRCDRGAASRSSRVTGSLGFWSGDSFQTGGATFYCPARDGHSLASARLALVLAVAIANPARPSATID